jgi:hypothetical protein
MYLQVKVNYDNDALGMSGRFGLCREMICRTFVYRVNTLG